MNSGPNAWREIKETGRSPGELRKVEEHERNLKNSICLIEKKRKLKRKNLSVLAMKRLFCNKIFY